MNKKILIADDEREIVELLKLYLEKEGYVVEEAFDGMEAIGKLNEDICLAVIDIMMPKLDGFQLVKKIREYNNIPVIILSARNADYDKILGLGLGADDYITKPFNPLEVLARVQAQLRRFYNLNQAREVVEVNKVRVVGELELDTLSCTLYLKGQPVQLTSTEYKLIYLFMEQPGRVYTKQQLFEAVWGDYFEGDDNTLMVHISKLREKIEKDPKDPVYLKTIRGLGYKLEKKVNV